METVKIAEPTILQYRVSPGGRSQISDRVGSVDGTTVHKGSSRLAAAEALRLATAYQVSRALHVALRLGLPDLLARDPQRPQSLSRDTGAHEPSLRRLLRVLAAYGVFPRQRMAASRWDRLATHCALRRPGRYGIWH